MNKKMKLDSKAFRLLARDRQDATVVQLTVEAYAALIGLGREHGIDFFEDPNIRLLRVCLTGIRNKA